MNGLPARIRAAAKRHEIGIEAMRKRCGLSGGTFYGLLRGEEPKTLRTLQKLQDAGVELPPGIFLKAS